MAIKPKLYFLLFIVFSFYQSIIFAQEEEKTKIDWTSYSQRIDISNKKGLEFRFSAYVRIGDLKQNGIPAIWLRIDDNEGQPGFFYNTIKNRSYVPSGNWKQLEIKGTIDEDAKYLYIGAFCIYNGDFYFDDFKLEIKSKEGTWKVENINNAGFEEKSSLDKWNWGIGVKSSNFTKIENFEKNYSTHRPFQNQHSLHIKGRSISRRNLFFENFKNDESFIWFSQGKRNNHDIKIDSIIKYKGDYSLLMQFSKNQETTCNTEQHYTSAASSIKGNFKDKEIKLTGYIKSENLKDNGQTGLWIRADPHIQTGFKNMINEVISSNSDWTKYEVVIIPHIDTFNLHFGTLFSGQGKIWVDNLELSIDGIPIQLYENNLHQEKWLQKYYKANIIKIEALMTSNNEKKQQKLNLAISYCNEAIDLVNNGNLKEKLISLYITKASIYSLYDDNSFHIEKAINNYFKALELAESYNDLNSTFIILSEMALFYHHSDYHNESTKILKQLISKIDSLKILKPESYKIFTKQHYSELPKIYDIIVHNYIKLKDAKNAEYYNNLFLKSFKNNRSLEYRRLLSIFYVSQGDIDVLKLNYTEANKNYQKARELIDSKCDNWGVLTSIYYSLGKVAYLLENYKKSYQILEEGLTLGRSEYEIATMYEDYFFYLAKSYANENNLKTAAKYFEMHSEYSSSLEKKEDTIAIALRKKEVEISLNEKNILELKKQKSEDYLLWTSAFFCFFTVCGIYQFRISKKKNEKKFKAILEEIQNRDQKISLLKIKENSPKSVLDINTETITKIIKGLQNLEEKHYFLKSECNTVNVAKKLKTNTTYLSKVISSHYHTNFNSYINDLRINYALSRLKEDIQFRHYSIQSISEELGYKSPDSFTKYFKKHTGLLPSYFIKKLNTNKS